MTTSLSSVASVPTSLPLTDPILIFGVAMLLVLLAPLLIRLLRLPSIVGLIAAGMAVGPNAAGLLERDATIVLLGTVGLLYLMFMAGLEIDLNEFSRARGKSFTFGFASFAIPQGLGTLVGYQLGFGTSAAVLLGSLFASHTLLAYPIASRLRIGKTESTTMAVGGTIVTDTLSLIVLAVVVGAQQGELNTEFWIRLCGSLAVYVVAVFVVVPRLGRWFFRRVEQAESQYIFVLAVLFVCSFLAEVAGVEAIVGAFFAGLALNRLIPESSALMNRINFVGNALFIPFFLLSVGMLVDVGVFFEGVDAIIVAATLTGTVILTKYLAARGSQMLFRFSRDEGMVIFGLSVPQAAATLAATLIGYDIGLFDQSTVNGVIVMILVTCILGPALVERFGRRVAEAEAGRVTSHGPPQRILVPLVDTRMLEPTLAFAMALRDAHGEEAIYPVTVVREGESAGDAIAVAEKLLREVEHVAAAASVAVMPLTQLASDTPAGLARAVVERRISDVVVGWDGCVAEGRAFGSIIDGLIASSNAELFVAHITAPLNTARRIVVAVLPQSTEAEGFLRAVGSVKKLAHQLGALVHVLSLESERAVVERTFAAASPTVTVSHMTAETFDAVLAAMGENMDTSDLALLMGTRGAFAPGALACAVPLRLADLVPGSFAVQVIGEPVRRELVLDEPGLRELLRRMLLQVEPGGPLDEALLGLLEIEFHLDEALPQQLARELLASGQVVELDGARIITLRSAQVPYPVDILALAQTSFASSQNESLRALGLVLAPVEESRRATERRVNEMAEFYELARPALGETAMLEVGRIVEEVAQAVSERDARG